MGQNFSSEPVVEKETERDHNDTFNVAVSSCQGWRMSQEDNHSLTLELPGDHKAAFFAVYDGHGSARVSKHASEGLWRHLVENDMYIKGNFEEALQRSFLTFDREVNESYNAQLAGTTAVCLLVVNNTIYCANIGDSRGVASVNCECVPLSYDHKPENPQELKRILAAGGYVLGNRVNGNLALSRAFGDFHYKGNDHLPPEQQIVSPYPDVKKLELNDDLDFLVLACDGIWDVLTSEEVVEFVISRLEQSMEPGTICEQLTTRCLATDYELVIGCDNMTVLLVCYTRGRSWMDFCTDIFNKNTRKLGMPGRVRPTLSEASNLDIPPEQQDTHARDVLLTNENFPNFPQQETDPVTDVYTDTVDKEEKEETNNDIDDQQKFIESKEKGELPAETLSVSHDETQTVGHCTKSETSSKQNDETQEKREQKAEQEQDVPTIKDDRQSNITVKDEKVKESYNVEEEEATSKKKFERIERRGG